MYTEIIIPTALGRYWKCSVACDWDTGENRRFQVAVHTSPSCGIESLERTFDWATLDEIRIAWPRASVLLAWFEASSLLMDAAIRAQYRAMESTK